MAVSRSAVSRAAAGPWAVGVDLGASRLRIVARDLAGRRRRVADAAAPGGALPDALARWWRRWRLRPGAVAGLVVAARGVWTPAERRALERRLRPLARRVRVVADVEAAHLAALAGAAGVLVLAGTGAIVLGHDGGRRWARAGGLGPLLGDDGSAFAIGRAWLRARAARGDLARARALAHAPDAPARIAALAPRVLRAARAGDALAREAVGAARRDLAAALGAVARGLALPAPVTVSWAGGLMADAAFRAGVWREARRAGLALRLHAPAAPAAAAAAALAAALARGGAGVRRPTR